MAISEISINRKSGKFGVFLYSLLYDSKRRLVVFQIVILAAVMSLFYWLASNASVNLEALGKPFSFDFLTKQASYNINTSLYGFSSQSPHWLAIAVGLTNSLKVAIVACITATFMGIAIGIGKLSSNLVIARVCALYVELIRNVPLLLQLLVIYGVLINFLPQPSKAAPMFFDLVFITNRSLVGPSIHLSSWFLPALALLIFGFVLSRTSHLLPVLAKYTTQFSRGAIAFGLLFCVLILVFGDTGLIRPQATRFSIKGGSELSIPFLALWLALSIYSSAMIAENIRAGIMSVAKGQSEAANALGLTSKFTMKLVILPQILPVVIPPIISQYINITKNSSLAIVVGYMDLTGVLGGVTLIQTGREIECIALLMLVYLIISLTLSGLVNLYSARALVWKRA